jgi:hypothetical protein
VKAAYYAQGEYAGLPDRFCEICGTRIGHRCRIARFCAEHHLAGKQIRRAETRRQCAAPGCERVVAGSNPSDFCWVCKPREAEIRAELERLAARPRCRNCNGPLGEQNRSGFCAARGCQTVRMREVDRAKPAGPPTVAGPGEQARIEGMRALADWITEDRKRRNIPEGGLTVEEMQRRRMARALAATIPTPRTS